MYCGLFLAPIVQVTRIILVKRLLPFSVGRYIKEVMKPCALVLLVSIVPSYYIDRYVQMHPIALSFVLFIIACVSVFLLGCTKGERGMVLRKARGECFCLKKL